MDFIKRILLILFLVLTTFSCVQVKAQESLHVDNAVISAVKPLEKDCLNSKDNEYNISALINSNSQILNRRNNDSQNGTTNDNSILLLKQFNNLISYIQNESYLDDKNELALLLLLHQIQPNAP